MAEIILSYNNHHSGGRGGGGGVDEAEHTLLVGVKVRSSTVYDSRLYTHETIPILVPN